MDIQLWDDIKQDFNDTLIVGNGSSIAVTQAFNYHNLYQCGCDRGFISEPVRDVFNKISKGRPDFERVLYRLWQADFINDKFGVDKKENEKVRKAYTDVRSALINTVKEVHPDKILCGDERLQHIGRFMTGFSTVFSLNYDLIVYWALLDAKQTGERRFNDGFMLQRSHQSSKKFLKRLFNLQFSAEPEQGLTKVFYPHGNLALYQTKGGEESKLVANDDGLLSSITQHWRSNDGQPLFVCEGSAVVKVATICKSQYLSHVFQQALPSPRDSITIYGWSIGKQDTHILHQLALSKCPRAAVSVFTGNKAVETIVSEVTHMRNMLRDYAGIESVEFFDAASAGCWNHAD